MFSPEIFIFYYICRINILSPIFLLNRCDFLKILNLLLKMLLQTLSSLNMKVGNNCFKTVIMSSYLLKILVFSFLRNLF